jgi:hypothetical protein
MLIPLILLIILIIITVPLMGRRSRKTRAEVGNVAAALGFELFEGMEAAGRMTPAALRQAAREQHEKMPDVMRKLVERTARNLLCAAGTVDGVEAAVYLESRSSGRSNATYTVVRADYPKPLPFELRVGHEGVLTRLGKAIGGLSDVEIGDEEFDRSVRVKAADTAAARDALGRPGARDAVLSLLALSPSAYATGTCACWEQQGTYLDPEKTRTRLAAVVAVAGTLGN